MPRVICLGHSAQDAIYRVPVIPAAGIKVLATAYFESGGGMAANASVAVARLGGEAAYWGRVGDDAVGERILADLTAEGVDVSSARRIAGCVSSSDAILVNDDGERLVCVYNDPALERDAAWLPVGAVALCQAVMADVRWPEGAREILGAAARYEIPGILDGDIGPREDLVALAALASHVVYSQPGLARATETSSPGEGLIAASRSTRAVVGVTLGSDGFLWREGGREQRMPAPRVTAVDTLAAGDVWHGAFTLALAEGSDVATAGRFANAAAAIKCSRPGGRRGAPTRDEVEALLKGTR